MIFDIEPTAGIRGLPLGSPRAAVREFFGTDPQVFRRTPSGNPADYWAQEGVFAYYDGADNLEALEFASPAEPKLDGERLTGAAMKQATAFLMSLDPAVSVEEGGASVHSTRLGVAIWCPTPEERGASVESVLVARGAYFA